MANFKLALNKKDSSLSVPLEQKIIEWSDLSVTQRKIVSNLYNEHFCPVDRMEQLIDQLVSIKDLPPEDFKNEVFKIYDSYTFSGGQAVIDVGIHTFGFSLTKFILRRVLDRNYLNDLFGGNPSQVEKFLSDKSIGIKDSLHDQYVSIKGASSILWVTWSQDSDDPFDFLKYNMREEVYNALALSDHYRYAPIFLFKIHRSEIEKKCILFRPTVFDANNYAPFLPAEPSFHSYGYTDPYNDSNLLINNIPLHCDKRPEAIVDGTNVTYSDIQFSKEL